MRLEFLLEHVSLFFDFQVDGVVRTADFTMATAGGPA